MSNGPISQFNLKVLWTAPVSGSGCISIRATVIEHRDVWYMDDGPLSRTICEDEADSVDTQPAIVNPCCACDEAKYEVKFKRTFFKGSNTNKKDYFFENKIFISKSKLNIYFL